MISFRSTSIAYAILWIALAVTLLVAPGVIYWLFSLPAAASTDVLARRAGMLFLGLATIAFFGRNASHSDLRQAVALGMTVSMFGLLALGVFEWARGGVGPGIWVAIVGEAIFGSLSGLVWLRGKGNTRSE